MATFPSCKSCSELRKARRYFTITNMKTTGQGEMLQDGHQCALQQEWTPGMRAQPREGDAGGGVGAAPETRPRGLLTEAETTLQK